MIAKTAETTRLKTQKKRAKYINIYLHPEIPIKSDTEPSLSATFQNTPPSNNP